MSQSLPPLVTVVIAARPGQEEVRAVEAVRQLKYPQDRLEVIIARGKQPSVQRNQAVREAKGDLIYFLDDDSVPLPCSLKRAVGAFDDETVQMYGGPNLCPADAGCLRHAFAMVMANPLAFGPSRARYAPIGELRSSGEKELILCNLVVRKSEFLAAGGFDESLYPNEENALMDELVKRGGKLMYDPDFVAMRYPRPNLMAFMRMLVTYGRGRAEQFRLHPGKGSLLNFVPPLFCLYLLAATVATNHVEGGEIAMLPMMVYVPIVMLGALKTLRLPVPRPLEAPCGEGKQPAPDNHGPVVNFIRVVPLIMLTHVAYGAGFWKGLFTTLKRGADRPKVEVTIERVTL